MAHAILMPRPGQQTEECTVIAWLKREGDEVHRGDVLFEIETDKSTMEVETFDDGVLLKIVAAAGETVPVNAVCAWVGEAGEAIPDAPVLGGPQAPLADAPEPRAVPAVAATGMTTAGATASDGPRLRISPRASRAAAEAGIDPRTVVGSGPDGRITERDVLAAARIAAPPGRAAGARTARTAAVLEGEGEPRPLSRMRRVIADRLTTSWSSIPHFTITIAVDATRLQALRAALKADGTTLTVTDFVLAATAQTLAEFPEVNSRTDGVQVWPRRRVHLGLAVAVPGGLVVPVIHDADRLSIGDLHDRAAGLAARARDADLGPDELSGSTFTVSNLGMFGVEEFSAIINPGEAAILAVSSAIPTPVALGDGLAVRSMMRLTLSADHRLVDGELGARFLGALRRRLEDDRALRLEAADS